MSDPFKIHDKLDSRLRWRSRLVSFPGGLCIDAHGCCNPTKATIRPTHIGGGLRKCGTMAQSITCISNGRKVPRNEHFRHAFEQCRNSQCPCHLPLFFHNRNGLLPLSFKQWPLTSSPYSVLSMGHHEGMSCYLVCALFQSARGAHK